MPGFNGRGPRGEGPMTGRKAGSCNATDGTPRSNESYGRGRGGAPWGCGRGLGRANTPSQASIDDERQYLTEHLSALEGEITDIRAKLEKLKADKK